MFLNLLLVVGLEILSIRPSVYLLDILSFFKCDSVSIFWWAKSFYCWFLEYVLGPFIVYSWISKLFLSPNFSLVVNENELLAWFSFFTGLYSVPSFSTCLSFIITFSIPANIWCKFFVWESIRGDLIFFVNSLGVGYLFEYRSGV